MATLPTELRRRAIDFKQLRADLKTAVHWTSYDAVVRLCARFSRPLETTANNLSKFVNSDTATINLRDAESLSHLLYETPFFAFLTATTPTRSIGVLLHFIQLLGAAGVHPDREAFANNSFFMFHGGHTHQGRDHYIKRAVRFSSNGPGSITVEEQHLDDLTLAQGPRSSTGLVIFIKGRPHMLFSAADNLRLDLFIATQVYPETGPIQRMLGTIMGTAESGIRSRAVLMLKTPIPKTLEQMTPLTGIKPLSSWSTEDQKRFQDLADFQFLQASPDPILNLAKKPPYGFKLPPGIMPASPAQLPPRHPSFGHGWQSAPPFALRPTPLSPGKFRH